MNTDCAPGSELVYHTPRNQQRSCTYILIKFPSGSPSQGLYVESPQTTSIPVPDSDSPVSQHHHLEKTFLAKILAKVRKKNKGGIFRLCPSYLDFEIFPSSHLPYTQTYSPLPALEHPNPHPTRVTGCEVRYTCGCRVNMYLFRQAAGPSRLWLHPLGFLPHPSPPAAHGARLQTSGPEALRANC